MLSIKEKIAKNYVNARGWSSREKYLLIESDDWGAIRMPSREVFETLKEHNIPVDKFSFDRNDSVESEEDLKALFNSLQKFTDRDGNPAVLTAYHVVANPNFEKIEQSSRKEYHFETILETYSRNKHTEKVPKLIRDGINKGLYIPQFHGREHIHVKRYMEAINSTSEKEQIAFANRAIVSSKSTVCKQPYSQDYFKGFSYSSAEEFRDLEDIHREGLQLFETIFGFSSVSITAQGGVYGDHILKMLQEEKVKLIGGQQQMPKIGGGYETINKFWGDKNKYGQVYWRRNCRFEPARNHNHDWVNNCLQEIEIAFRWGKPAVVSSHRENFIGSIFENNRDQSLEKMEELLRKVVTKWPDVKFISTEKLASLM